MQIAKSKVLKKTRELVNFWSLSTEKNYKVNNFFYTELGKWSFLSTEDSQEYMWSSGKFFSFALWATDLGLRT